MGWRSRARQGARERKNGVAPYSYRFHFNFPDKRQEKTGPGRKPDFNTRNMFCLRYPTSFSVRILRFTRCI